MHRPLPENFKKHCGAILVKDHKGWLVNFKIEIEEAPEKKPINSAVGLDVGLRALVATSDETSDRNFYDAPKYFKKAEKNYADYNGRWHGARKEASVGRRRNNG